MVILEIANQADDTVVVNAEPTFNAKNRGEGAGCIHVHRRSGKTSFVCRKFLGTKSGEHRRRVALHAQRSGIWVDGREERKAAVAQAEALHVNMAKLPVTDAEAQPPRAVIAALGRDGCRRDSP